MASYWNFLKHPVDLVKTLWDNPQPAIGPLEAAPTAPSTVEQAAAGINQITAPHGLCGGIPNDVGSSTWVCQAFGQVMPGIVFVVSMVVIFATVVFLFRFILRSRRAARELDRVNSQLARLPSLGNRDWAAAEQSQKILKVLAEGGRHLPPLSGLRTRIESHLITLEDANQKVALSQSLEKLIQEKNGLSRWTGEGLAEQLPSWLTAIGLLTTFLAILLGLQNVRVLSNLEVQGIGGLVNGLSGKFFSSIVALGCAITVTIFHYVHSERVNAAWTQMIQSLQALLPSISVERAFLDLLKERRQKSQ